MKLKKLLSSAVVGLSMMAFAGTASADYITSDINIYGASAQYIFWRDNGTAYMSNNNCSGFQYGKSSDGKHFLIKATCLQNSSDHTGTTRYMRISSKASYDGILAVMGSDSAFGPRVKDCDPDYNKRKMLEDTSCTLGNTVATAGTCATTSCEPVTVGASDTAANCFTQMSDGHKLGPLGGTFPYSADMSGMPVPDGSVLVCKPLIVPFTFYANNTVKKGGTPITNISYDNLQLIFSGQITNWNQLYDADGVAYDSQDLVACMRHAGSGTQASLEAYLMASVVCSKDNYLATGEMDNVYFNDGSGDEMKCVNGSGSWAGAGAIGYADADQDLSGYTNTNRLTVSGVPATYSHANLVDTLKNGFYNFYGQQHLYGVNPESGLCQFISSFSVAAPWVKSSDMVYERNDTCCSWGQHFR